MTQLRSYDSSPPGGYSYVQPEPKGRNFHAEPLIEAQARIVMGYRKGNGLPRATFAECLVDIGLYTCARLGNNPKFCKPVTEDNREGVAMHAGAPGLTPCHGCGNPV